MKTKTIARIVISLLLFFAITLNLRLIFSTPTNNISFELKYQKAHAYITPDKHPAVCGCGSVAFEDWETCCCIGNSEPCTDSCNSTHYNCS